MSFLKAHLQWILFGVICLGSLGMGGWAIMAADDTTEQMGQLDNLLRDVSRQRANAANEKTIEVIKKQTEEDNSRLKDSLAASLATQKNNAFDGQPRKLLHPDVLPKPKSRAAAIDFKAAYREAFNKLIEQLHGRSKATPQEIAEQEVRQDSKNLPSNPGGGWTWGPKAEPEERSPDVTVSDSGEKRPLEKVLSEYPNARAAELVARRIRMYVDRGALSPHDMVRNQNVPNAVAIWEAQISLWIQQDIVTALAKVNDERAAALKADGRLHDAWVANMPIKRLKNFAIRGWLGGGTGINNATFAGSFTTVKNDKKRFVVPVQLDLFVEEASLMRVFDSLCSVGFYTPTNVEYRSVRPNALQDDYIYGEEPVLQVTIDLEGYYFREVFDDWIPEKPKNVKKILSTPGAKDDTMGRR